MTRARVLTAAAGSCRGCCTAVRRAAATAVLVAVQLGGTWYTTTMHKRPAAIDYHGGA